MKFLKAFMLIAAMALASASAQATTPVSPSFGGSGLTGTFTSLNTFSLLSNSSYVAKIDNVFGGMFALFDDKGHVLDGFVAPSKTTTFGSLLAGTYTFGVFGTGVNASWSFTTAALPVPEANEAGMMLSGLAMLGLIAVRRRNNI